LARRSRSAKRAAGTGIGLAVFLLGVIAYVMRDHWPWLAGAGAAVAIAWIWWLASRRRLARSMAEIDAMGGHEFERYLARAFRKLGYGARLVGEGGSDFGADIVIERRGIRVAVQAKNHVGGARVGNDAVQQAIAGATYYKCRCAMVVTNSRFTRAAHAQAAASEAIPVILLGRRELELILGGRLPPSMP